jgi:hypothetical protein
MKNPVHAGISAFLEETPYVDYSAAIIQDIVDNIPDMITEKPDIAEYRI